MADRFRVGQGGFLLDRNGDGFVDDLALRIVLPPESDKLPHEIWRSLIDLTARVGLESAGLPERLVLDQSEGVAPDSVRLLVLPPDLLLETTDGTVGFVPKDKLRPIAGYRLLASSRDGEWSFTALIAGD